MKNGSQNARRVCASRRLLYQRLDEGGRRFFADAARVCDGAT